MLRKGSTGYSDFIDTIFCMCSASCDSPFYFFHDVAGIMKLIYYNVRLLSGKV